jgi:DNA-binding response OmpR family regulator
MPKAKTAEKPKAFILDDNWQMRMALEMFFRNAGYEVVTASSYREALELWSTNPDVPVSDVFVSDYELGDKSGIDFFNHVSAHVKKPVFMLVSGKDMTGDEVALFKKLEIPVFDKKDGQMGRKLLAEVKAALDKQAASKADRPKRKKRVKAPKRDR